MGGKYSAYTDAWARNRYVEVRPEEFTYNPQRGEVARDKPGDGRQVQTVDTVDSPVDTIASPLAADWHGITQEGFPDTFWPSPEPGYGQDEVLQDRTYHEFESRHVSNGAPAHRLRAWSQMEDVSHTYRSSLDFDPEARLLPDPTGPDAERLIRAGHGAFNAYEGTNSFARKPHEFFRRENRDMHDPAGLDSRHDVRPLFYNKGAMPVDAPSSGGSERWGFVYNAWDTFTPEYLAEAPYDRVAPEAPTLTDPTTPDHDWAW